MKLNLPLSREYIEENWYPICEYILALNSYYDVLTLYVFQRKIQLLANKEYQDYYGDDEDYGDVLRENNHYQSRLMNQLGNKLLALIFEMHKVEGISNEDV